MFKKRISTGREKYNEQKGTERINFPSSELISNYVPT